MVPGVRPAVRIVHASTSFGSVMVDPRLIVLALLVFAVASLIDLVRHIRSEGEYRPIDQAALAAGLGRYPRTTTTFGWLTYGLMLIILVGQLFLPVDPQDEGQWLTYPWLIAHGRMPYRDIWMTYPPSTYLITALLVKLGVPGIVAARGPGLVSRAIYPLIVNRALTGSWTRFSWLAVPLTFCAAFGASDIMAYPWILAMPLLFLGLVALHACPLTAAALFFLAGGFRFEFAVAGFVALSALAALNAVQNRPYRRAAIAAVSLAFGFLIFIALINWITSGYVVRVAFLDQLGPVQRGRFMALWPPDFGPLGVPLALVVFCAPPLLFVVGLVARRPHLAAGTLAVIVLMSHYYQRAERAHLYGVAAIALPWLVVGLVDLGDARGTLSRPGRRRTLDVAHVPGAVLAWVVVPLTFWLVLILAGYAAYVSPLSPLATTNLGSLSGRVVRGSNGNITIDRDRGEATDDREVIMYLRAHSSPSQSIFIGPRRLRIPNTRTDLYDLLPVRPASRYLEIQPGLEAQISVQREIMRQLRTCTWVLLLHGGQFYRFATRPYPVPNPLLDRYIASHYVVVLRNSTYDLMRRA